MSIVGLLPVLNASRKLHSIKLGQQCSFFCYVAHRFWERAIFFKLLYCLISLIIINRYYLQLSHLILCYLILSHISMLPLTITASNQIPIIMITFGWNEAVVKEDLPTPPCHGWLGYFGVSRSCRTHCVHLTSTSTIHVTMGNTCRLLVMDRYMIHVNDVVRILTSMWLASFHQGHANDW